MHQSQNRGTLIGHTGGFGTDQGKVIQQDGRKLALIHAVVAFKKVGTYHPAKSWLMILGHMAFTLSSLEWTNLNMKLLPFHPKKLGLLDQHGQQKDHSFKDQILMS